MVVDRMARSGVDVATAASLTGHSPEVMLRHYRQVSDEDRKKAVVKARLGHFPEKGQVIQGPWEATGE
jgi:integrase